MGKSLGVLGVLATAGLVAGTGMAGASGPLAQGQKLTVGTWLALTDGGRVHVAGELPCPADGEARGVDNPNLRVKTEEGVFQLASAETSCAGEGGRSGGRLFGSGLGTLNDVPMHISFDFTDTGSSDQADYVTLELGSWSAQRSRAGHAIHIIGWDDDLG